MKRGPATNHDFRRSDTEMACRHARGHGVATASPRRRALRWRRRRQRRSPIALPTGVNGRAAECRAVAGLAGRSPPCRAPSDSVSCKRSASDDSVFLGLPTALAMRRPCARNGKNSSTICTLQENTTFALSMVPVIALACNLSMRPGNHEVHAGRPAALRQAAMCDQGQAIAATTTAGPSHAATGH